MSLGGPTPTQPILVDAIHKAAADGILLVAATGNDARRRRLAGGRAAAERRRAELRARGRRQRRQTATSPASPTPASTSRSSRPALPATPAPACSSRSRGRASSATAATRMGRRRRATNTATSPAPRSRRPRWPASPRSSGRYGRSSTNYQVADIIKQSARRAAGADWTPTSGCGVLDAGAALELATSRSAAEWSTHKSSSDAVCSADTSRPRRVAQRGDPDHSVRGSPRQNDRRSRLQGRRNRLVPVAGLLHGERHVHDAPRAVHIVGVGVCGIIASQGGNANFNPARSVTRPFSITKAPRVRRHRSTTATTKGTHE